MCFRLGFLEKISSGMFPKEYKLENCQYVIFLPSTKKVRFLAGIVFQALVSIDTNVWKTIPAKKRTFFVIL